MKSIPALVLVSMIAVRAEAWAQASRTNNIGRAEAVRIASQFRVGTAEREVARILEHRGLTNEGGVASSFAWSCSYRLSDGCVLSCEMKPKQFGDDWGDGLLVSACIRSNGVGVVSIPLKNALQPGGPANRSQPIRPETNRVPGAAGSGR
jgi:hypothetical protein